MDNYLLIKVGFEGIDKLIWLSNDPKEIKKIRKRAIEVDIAKSNLSCKKIKIKRIFTDNEIIKCYCIQKWDRGKFNCACRDLGIGITIKVLY